MTIKELTETTAPNIDIIIRFNGDEIAYSQPIAAIVDNIIIDRIEADTTPDKSIILYAIAKLQPVKKEG